MNILVLGGGQQGRVIAGDLARSLGSARITVADVREPRLAPLSNLRWLSADLSDPAALAPAHARARPRGRARCPRGSAGA